MELTSKPTLAVTNAVRRGRATILWSTFDQRAFERRSLEEDERAKDSKEKDSSRLR